MKQGEIISFGPTDEGSKTDKGLPSGKKYYLCVVKNSEDIINVLKMFKLIMLHILISGSFDGTTEKENFDYGMAFLEEDVGRRSLATKSERIPHLRILVEIEKNETFLSLLRVSNFIIISGETGLRIVF